MTTPDTPLRAVVEYEVPGTPEQIWAAIATAEGIGAWFMRTDLDGRVGGAIVTHMGEDASSPGTVTGWNPPHRVPGHGARRTAARGVARRVERAIESHRRGPGAVHGGNVVG